MAQTLSDDFDDNDKVETPQLNLWDWKNEDTIVGIIREIGEGNFDGRKIGVITKEGGDLVYIPEMVALNSALKDAVIGDKLKIVHTGQEKSKNKRIYETFDVFIKHN